LGGDQVAHPVGDDVLEELGELRWCLERASVGFLGGFRGLDGPATANITRELLGCQPTAPGLIADLKEGHYFA